MGAILKVENLGVSFLQYTKGLKEVEAEAITQLDIDLLKGEVLAVIGSSGSGKSLLAHAILGILPQNARVTGDIYYKDLLLSQKDKEALRGKKIALVPQSVNYLDPLQKVGDQLKTSFAEKGKKEKNMRLAKMLDKYGLEQRVADCYPHQLSGGMARKILLNTALATDCDIIIADEPTPGLDRSSLKEALGDFRKAANDGKAVILITHDISAAVEIADRIAIFYAGTTLEIINKEDLVSRVNIGHPYTKALIKALPQNGFEAIEGSQPLPTEMPEGCVFFPRCPIRKEKCEKERPSLNECGGKARCFYATSS